MSALAALCRFKAHKTYVKWLLKGFVNKWKMLRKAFIYDKKISEPFSASNRGTSDHNKYFLWKLINLFSPRYFPLMTCIFFSLPGLHAYESLSELDIFHRHAWKSLASDKLILSFKKLKIFHIKWLSLISINTLRQTSDTEKIQFRKLIMEWRKL